MKVIITGSTGMVGRAVLIECLESSKVEAVLLVNRSPIGVTHPKIKEVILADFSEISTIKAELGAYDACFYCMGVSAFGMSEEDYTRISYTMTEAFVDTLYELNPGMVFNYVSGAGTDGTEQGRIMWARVKGRTENMVLGRGFKDAYAFRPGFILPEKGVRSKTRLYNTFYVVSRPFFPLFRRMKSTTLSSEIGTAMINSVVSPYEYKILESTDIKDLAIGRD